jgi:hypothetical protein
MSDINRFAGGRTFDEMVSLGSVFSCVIAETLSMGRAAFSTSGAIGSVPSEERLETLNSWGATWRGSVLWEATEDMFNGMYGTLCGDVCFDDKVE